MATDHKIERILIGKTKKDVPLYPLFKKSAAKESFRYLENKHLKSSI